MNEFDRFPSEWDDYLVLSECSTSRVKIITALQELCDRTRTHNYSTGLWAGYFELDKWIERNRVALTNESILVYRRGRTQVISLVDSPEDPLFTSITGKGRIFSPVYRYGVEKGYEVMYRIPDVLDPTKYHNSKRRQQLLTRPLRVIAPLLSYEPLTSENLHTAKDLHDRWVQQKLLKQGLHLISFPSARYIKLWERLSRFVYDGLSFGELISFDGKPFAFRIASIEGDTAYLLTSISLYWESPVPDLSSAAFVCWARHLQELFPHVEYINSGQPVDRDLKYWKQKFPHTMSPYYSRPFTRIPSNIP